MQPHDEYYDHTQYQEPVQSQYEGAAYQQQMPTQYEEVVYQQQMPTQHMQVPTPGTNVIYLQAPKYSNWPMRILSSVMLIFGILIYFAGMATMSCGDESIWPVTTCCGLWWAAMIPELIYYHGMVGHNSANGMGTGWAITNLVLGYMTLVIGGIGLIYILIVGSMF